MLLGMKKIPDSHMDNCKKMSQVEPDHYFDGAYDSKERFCSYWHQINEIIELRPKKALEIGVGNGFLSNYLKKKKINLMTMDIDKRLNPDVVGSVLELPFANKSFDVVACYEVLEHLSYEVFPKALSEIHRVSGSYAVLSMPDLSRVYRFGVQVPKIGELKMLIPLLRLKPLTWEFNGEHFWNIGTAGYPLHRITHDICNVGFEMEKNYRVFEIPWHRFFVLAKVE